MIDRSVIGKRHTFYDGEVLSCTGLLELCSDTQLPDRTSPLHSSEGVESSLTLYMTAVRRKRGIEFRWATDLGTSISY